VLESNAIDLGATQIIYIIITGQYKDGQETNSPTKRHPSAYPYNNTDKDYI